MMTRAKDIPRPGGPKPLDIGYEDSRGRILVADSMSYFDDRVESTDVLVCGSFAGSKIADQLGLCWGPRAMIAHACGVGKDDAGISGLALCEELGVPMAAVDTMSAGISRGRSVYEEGRISHVNKPAEVLGVVAGQLTSEAAQLMLDAIPGTPLKSDITPSDVDIVYRGEEGAVYAVWNVLLLLEQAPLSNDVVCIAMHSGKVMAEWSAAAAPKGVIGNDGGFGKDDTGIAGLAMLERQGIAAASVAAMSARIGDARSTYYDGEISAMNAIAQECGVRVGMIAKEAARLMIESNHAVHARRKR
ncbi:hypothetical protein [Marinobacter orientalis]|uniref:Uncharacterized protein n=1 Tax=Marinobacter orientalis TaxID=1928859 RepID=A0A7Y0REX7_9GAMM|nr:hypothetical protein [Marinobacter orientalis]NMT65009.1 hypothetical protein [Marinobacter orientalis]TGX48100.1 hypothetical protein DIT72_15890 [Marinobacter orientalis]